jgi:hypothetical protein
MRHATFGLLAALVVSPDAEEWLSIWCGVTSKPVDPVPWRDLFARLDAMPVDSSTLSRQRRGQEFEAVLRLIFEEARMDPRSRYRPQGEEIDGSFVHQGRPMLLEAKWTADPIPASTANIHLVRGE